VRALHGQSAHESDQLDIAILERDGQRALQARVRSPGGVTETDNTRSRNRRYRTKLAEAKRERAGKPKHEHKRARSIYIRQRGLLLQARDSQRKADQDSPHARSSKTRRERKRIEGRNGPFNACNRMKSKKLIMRK
jgi:hypothetical protein